MLHVSVEAVAVGSGALIAAAVGIFGWYGRQADGHPHCRKCGFDLHLKPENARRCAECGALLTSRRAVRRGRRVIRPRPLLVGLLVLVICGTDGWFHAYRLARGTDWDRHKPLWWLERQADSLYPNVRDAALAGLTRRVFQGALPADRERALVAKALVRQANPLRAWAPGWGDVVEAVHQTGRLDSGLWDRHELDGIQIHLEPVARTMRSCDPVTFRVASGPHRYGNSFGDDDFVPVVFFNNKLKIDRRYHSTPVEVEYGKWGFDLPADQSDFCPWATVSRYRGNVGNVVLPSTEGLSFGRHRVEATVLLGMARYSESKRVCRVHAAMRRISLACDFTFSASPDSVYGPELRDAVKKSVRVNGVRYINVGSAGSNSPELGLEFDVDFVNPPENLSYMVQAYVPDVGDWNIPLTDIYVPKGQSRHVLFPDPGDKLRGKINLERVVLQLVPHGRASPVGTSRVWDEDMSFSHLREIDPH